MYNLDLPKPGTAVATRAATDETWWKFTTYNSQAMYGWGSEDEASAYVDHLNDGKDVNLYSYAEVTDPELIAELDDGNEGFNLSDELASRSRRNTRAATAVTVVEPVPCRMRAVVCRSINERAIVEYTGSETDDRNAVLEAILPQIPDDAWTRSEANSWSYIDSLECIDGDEAVAEAGAMRSAQAMATRAMTQSEKVPLLREVVAGISQANSAIGQIDRLFQNTLFDQIPALLQDAEEMLAIYEEFAAAEAAGAGGERQRSALATRQDGPGQAAGAAPELEQMLTAIDELIAAAMAAAADADPEALSAAAAEADAQLEALREKFASIPPAGDAAADA